VIAYLQYVGGGNILSTPSLGITCLRKSGVEREDAETFNSLSRDHSFTFTSSPTIFG